MLKQVKLWEELGEDLACPLHHEQLSGGQRMKLEIARNLLRQKPILLADEITAALDAQNAQEIRQLLHQLPVTLVEIAHHYEANHYERIVELKHGQVYTIKKPASRTK